MGRDCCTCRRLQTGKEATFLSGLAVVMLGADEECSCGRCERTFMSLIYITTATTSSVWSMPFQQSPVGPQPHWRAAPRRDSPLLSRGVCSPGEQSQERGPACLYLGRMGSRCCDTTATLFLLFFSSSWAVCLSVSLAVLSVTVNAFLGSVKCI